jgi:hypothetical protein
VRHIGLILRRGRVRFETRFCGLRRRKQDSHAVFVAVVADPR